LATFKEKTTSVSSTLFECALQGEADARIQEMADVLMSTDIPFPTASHGAIALGKFSRGQMCSSGCWWQLRVFKTIFED